MAKKLRFNFLLLLITISFCVSAQTRSRGIDVSKFQGTVNWTNVAKDSTIKFVYIKATEGTTIKDQYYRQNIRNASKAGLLVGSYHVYSSKTTAYQQMANMKSMIKKKDQDLVPVLDIEGHHANRLNMQRVDKLLELMEDEYGTKPMIYTSEKVYKVHFSGRKYRKYHIFIANYNSYPTVRFTLWQFTQTGHIDGISGYVDINRFNRDRSISDILMPKKNTTAAQKNEKADKAADTASSANI